MREGWPTRHVAKDETRLHCSWFIIQSKVLYDSSILIFAVNKPVHNLVQSRFCSYPLGNWRVKVFCCSNSHLIVTVLLQTYTNTVDYPGLLFDFQALFWWVCLYILHAKDDSTLIHAHAVDNRFWVELPMSTPITTNPVKLHNPTWYFDALDRVANLSGVLRNFGGVPATCKSESTPYRKHLPSSNIVTFFLWPDGRNDKTGCIAMQVSFGYTGCCV